MKSLISRKIPSKRWGRHSCLRCFAEQLESRRYLAAQVYNWQNIAVKGNGFVNGIVYSPAQQNLAFAHTDIGGAYRWDQAAAKWTPLNDFSQWNDWPLQNMGVETLAVDPTDPSRVYMGAGTYDSPTAILRSTDGGVTWSRANVSFTSNGNGLGRNAGERLVVDPNSPNILFYGTRKNGLWKSTTYGANWSQVGAFPSVGETSGFANDVGIVWVLFDKSSATSGNPSQNIYAGVVNVDAGDIRIYRSTDGGASWAALLGGQPTTANYFPQRAALAPDGSALYITYGFSTSAPGPYGITAGFVEKVTSPSSATPTWSAITPPGVGSAWGFSGVALDPTNPSSVYVTELNDYNPADRIWHSTNGGSTWSVISPNSNRDNSSAAYANSLSVHWMGDLEIDPFNNNVPMFTTGFGIYRTTNLTAGNPLWTFFNDGLEESAVLELASPNTGSVNLFHAQGDRDGFRHDDFTQSPAIGRLGQLNGLAEGTSDDIDVAWNDASYLVRVVRVSPWVQYSTNNGVNWAWMPSSGTSGSTSGGGNIAISADGLYTVYEPGGTGRARYSVRSGSTWSGWTTPATNQPANGAKIVADLVDPRTFYAYVGTTVSRSTDGGANWTVMTTAAPAVGNWIRAVPGNAGNLWMSRNANGLWRTTNGGTTWTQVGSGVVTTANAVGVGAAAPNQSYPAIFVAGTVSGTTGFFRSDDQGATWVTISDVAHQFGYVTVIQGDPRVYGRLYIGANGRGVLYGEIADSTPPTVNAAQYLFQTSPNTLTFTFSENVSASLASGDLIITASLSATYGGYDSGANTATFTLTTPLSDGDYQAKLIASGISDAAGNALPGDFTFPFFFLNADANHDRSVDTSDFNALAANFGLTGKTFPDGDFNYDTIVDSLDFNNLAAQFGKSLDAQRAASAPLPAGSEPNLGASLSKLLRDDDDILDLSAQA